MSELQTRIADLPPEKLKLLRQRLLDKKRREPALPSVVSAPDQRCEPFPLTDVQQAYWIGRQGLFELGNVASHAYVELPFPELEVERLNRALDRLIERHEMLRAIVLPDGRQQILEKVPPYEVAILDLRGRSEDETEEALSQIRGEMSHQLLLADRWPLFDMRATLLDRRSLIHLSFDILIGDLWSFQILRRELGQLYLDPTVELEPLELSFRDYVLAEVRFESSELYQRSLDYWQERLEDLPPAPDLPLARNPASLAQPRFVRRRASLPAGPWRRLKEHARSRGLTPSSLLLAVYAEVLATWSRTSRFTLNVTTFNRLPVHPQINQVVGDFTSLTLVSVDASDASFEERARTVREQLWRDLEHGHVSAIRLLRRMTKGSGPAVSMPVVFTSMLFEQDEDEAPEEEESAVFEDDSKGSDQGISQTPQVWLDFQIGEDRGVLNYNWDAVEELFPEGLLDDMFSALRHLLTELAEDEKAWRKSSFDPLPPAQRERRRQVNATVREQPTEPLQCYFERRALERPEQRAVVSSRRTLAYGELDRLSNRLAHELRGAGAEPNQLVVVLMEKGWEQVAAVLAILKAGAAYLPIDPDLPVERVNYLISHGEARLVLAQPWIAERFDLPACVEQSIPVAWETADEEDGIEPLEPVQGMNDLAYVIFTSGSTGLPKGVAIDHLGAANTVIDINRRFAVGPEDAVLALSALSFDLSVWDIFGLLAVGGTIVLPEPEARRSPERWLELLEQQRVTIWDTVPALMEMLVEYTESQPGAGLETLRLAMMSGDWIPVRLPDRIRALGPRTDVISLGGATEASIWSIYYPIGEVPADWNSIPYGRPLDNQTFHVLDQRLEPRPDWVVGDLFIGGIGLAREYWRDDEKTRASFITRRGDERLYRTGDLGRYLPSGDIEFLGREDLQVKIQGYRIELGEIEAALEQYPGVRTGVVLALGDKGENRRLVACVVPEESTMSIPAEVAAPVTSAAGSEDSAEWFTDSDGARRWPLPTVVTQPPDALRAIGEEVVQRPVFDRLLRSLVRIELQGEALPKYRYASAGTLYPVQTYVAVRANQVSGLDGGLYYVHPQDHALVEIAKGTTFDDALEAALAPAGRSDGSPGAFVLFLIGKLDAIEPIYGTWSRLFCLLEAGYIGELLSNSAAAAGLALERVTVADFAALRPLLDLDERHLLLHTLIGGSFTQTPADADNVVNFPAPATVPGAGEPVLVTDPTPIADPIEGQIPQLEFKLGSPGLRSDDEGKPRVSLELPESEEAFRRRYRKRRSYRSFASRQIRLDDLGKLLADMVNDALERSRSTESNWQLETYLHIKPDRVIGLPGGVYRYDAEAHQLELRGAGDAIGRHLHAPVNREVFDAAAVSIFLTTRPSAKASSHEWQQWLQDFAALQVGYRGHRLMTAAIGTGIGLCPIGPFEFAPVRGFFQASTEEDLVHSLLVGPVDEADSSAIKEPATSEHERAFQRALSDFLATKLPAYMIPSSMSVFDRLPLTANGKVDRKALAAQISLPQAEKKTAKAPPRNDLERKIANVWREVLGLDSLGMNDNFYDLGGHSVAMVQTHRRLEQSLEQKISITDLFRYPTPRELASFLGPKANVSARSEDTNRAQRRRQARRRTRRGRPKGDLD